jgi:hypothetical protein
MHSAVIAGTDDRARIGHATVQLLFIRHWVILSRTSLAVSWFSE